MIITNILLGIICIELLVLIASNKPDARDLDDDD
jgi:hypothetical protein